jgi:hypothetical protein
MQIHKPAMSSNITSGRILDFKKEPGWLRVRVLSKSKNQQYLTELRLGLTNYAIEEGDYLNWSPSLNVPVNPIVWWSKPEVFAHMNKLWLEGVESQKCIEYE